MSEEDQLELDLKELIVPWEWEHVKLKSLPNEAISWLNYIELQYEEDYFIHMVDEFNNTLYPYSQIKMRYHYIFFKDPANLTAFLLATPDLTKL